jgi:hypothetical protein
MKVLLRDIKKLVNILENIDIPINFNRGRKKDLQKRHGSDNPAGIGMTQMLGYYQKDKLTNFTKEHPDIYEELKQLASKYVPFPVSKFMLNKNYITKPHLDSKNKGESVIFSFGKYKGGELVVDGKIVDIHMKPYKMNPTVIHWNKPLESGTKYSIVFFN